MNDKFDTPCGMITLRTERPSDDDFLYGLFRSHALPALAAVPCDERGRETLVRIQFQAQSRAYRDQFPVARFGILCRAGDPVGRLIVDAAGEVACIVDFALLPAIQAAGVGSAILRGVLVEQRKIVRCTVLASNVASLRMCRRVGFVQIGAEPPFVQLEWCPPSEV